MLLCRSNVDADVRATYHLAVDWAIITIVGLSAPFVLLWGWVKYLDAPTLADWRSRASVVGLSFPVLSGLLWIVALLLALEKNWHTSNPTMQHFITAGVWVPIVGMLVGFAGRPRLILAIVPASIGMLLFWFTTTLP